MLPVFEPGMEDAEINYKMNRRLPYYGKRNLGERKRLIYLQRASRAFRPQSRKETWTWIEKHLADVLTFSRVFLGLYLIWSGLVDGRAALAQDVWILVLAWSTDIVDGRISRTLSPGHQSWLGKNDVYVDMFFSVSVLVFLMITGLLPVEIGLVYMIVWGALMARWGIPPLFAQFFQNPIYAYFLILTALAAPWVFPWLLLWALVAALLFGTRMIELLKGVFGRFREARRKLNK
jgi:hypothetical protein